MDNDATLADGTSVASLYRFFYQCLHQLQQEGWKWQIRQVNTDEGLRFAMSAYSDEEVHIVVSQDVERMVQELLRKAVPAANINA